MNKISGLWKCAAAGTVIWAASCAPASAQFYGGWQYAIDSLNDGSGTSGSVSYEIRGLAYKEVGGKAIVAISSGMPQAGNVVGGALNGSINYGDMFFNFSGGNLDTQAKFTNANVFAVRLDGNNDSLGNTGSNHTLGVYGNLTAVSLTTSNSGYGTLQDYINSGFGRTTDAMADLENSTGDVKTYLSNGTMYPNISAGTKLGDVTLLSRSNLGALGLDFSHFSGVDPSGNNVFGFEFDRNLLPNGKFTAHVFEECINDGVAIQAVPEPGTYSMMGLSLATGGAIFLRRRKKSA